MEQNFFSSRTLYNYMCGKMIVHFPCTKILLQRKKADYTWYYCSGFRMGSGYTSFPFVRLTCSCLSLEYLCSVYHWQLKDEVCSPAGTSVQAIQALEKQGLRGLMMEAVQIASKRAAELSRIENGEKQDFALKRR